MNEEQTERLVTAVEKIAMILDSLRAQGTTGAVFMLGIDEGVRLKTEPVYLYDGSGLEDISSALEDIKFEIREKE